MSTQLDDGGNSAPVKQADRVTGSLSPSATEANADSLTVVGFCLLCPTEGAGVMCRLRAAMPLITSSPSSLGLGKGCAVPRSLLTTRPQPLPNPKQ